jgi:predicted transcriptional regulator
MKRLFLKLKPTAVLLLLKDSQQSWYPSKLARESGSSYVHTVNLLAQLRKFGVVTSEKKGKQNIYKLTEKGAYLASALDDFAKKSEAAGQEARAAQAKQEQAQSSQPQPAPTEEKKPDAVEKK